jgi:hypothetical protein
MDNHIRSLEYKMSDGDRKFARWCYWIAFALIAYLLINDGGPLWVAYSAVGILCMAWSLPQ